MSSSSTSSSVSGSATATPLSKNAQRKARRSPKSGPKPKVIIYIDDSGSVYEYVYVNRVQTLAFKRHYQLVVDRIISQYPAGTYDVVIRYWSAPPCDNKNPCRDSVTFQPKVGNATLSSCIATDLTQNYPEYADGLVYILTDGAVDMTDLKRAASIMRASGLRIRELQFEVCRTSPSAIQELSVMGAFAAGSNRSVLRIDGRVTEMTSMSVDEFISMVGDIDTFDQWTASQQRIQNVLQSYALSQVDNETCAILTNALKCTKKRVLDSMKYVNSGIDVEPMTNDEIDGLWLSQNEGPASVESQCELLIKKLRDVTYDYNAFLNSRLATSSAAATVNTEAALEEVVDLNQGSATFECSVSLDSDVPVLLIDATPIGETVAREAPGVMTDAATNNPGALVDKGYLTPNMIGHAVGAQIYSQLVSQATSSTSLAPPVDPAFDTQKQNVVSMTQSTNSKVLCPFTRQEVVGIPLGCDPASMELGNFVIRSKFFGGKCLGNPTLVLMVIYDMLKDLKQDFREEYLQHLKAHIEYRLDTVRVPVSLTGLQTFPQFPVRMRRALQYVVNRASNVYSMTERMYRVMMNFGTVQQRWQTLFERVCIVRRLLTNIPNDKVVRHLSVCLTNVVVVIHGVACPVDGVAVPVNQAVAQVRAVDPVLADLLSLSVENRAMVYRLLSLGRSTLLSKSLGTFDNILSATYTALPPPAHNFDLTPIMVPFNICPATLWSTVLVCSSCEQNTAQVSLVLGKTRYQSLVREFIRLVCGLERFPTQQEFVQHIVDKYTTTLVQFSDMVDELFEIYQNLIGNTPMDQVVEIMEANLKFNDRVRNQNRALRDAKR